MPVRRGNGMRTRTVVSVALAVGVTVVAATSVNYAAASNSVPKFAPSAQEADASVPQGRDGEAGGDGQTNYNYGTGDRGRIYVNERTYSAEAGDCIAVISSPATSFNVRNETGKTIEFFNGITCDNGAAIEKIGPRDSSSAIPGTVVLDGAVVPFALVGSFRAIDKRH